MCYLFQNPKTKNKIVRNGLFGWTFVIMLCCLGAISCTDTIENSAPVPVPEDRGGNYQERTVPVVRVDAPESSVKLRFYDDMPSVPYIALSDYQRMMMPGSLISINKQGGIYELQNSDGSATVNVYEDTFFSNDYPAFTNLMSTVQEGMPNVYYDGSPYIRYKSMTITPTTVPTTFNFKRYGIDLHGDDHEVYFPLATLSDLYSDLHYHIAGFNGEKVVLVTDPYNGTISTVDPSFTLSVYQNESVTDDMADFRYNELSFAIDHFYGKAGRSPFEEMITTKGLDGLLESQGEKGQQVKQLLKSNLTAAFALGMQALQYYLGDGGHTNLFIINNMPESVRQELWNRAAEVAKDYRLATEALNDAVAIYNESWKINKVLTEQRQERLGSKRYYKVGNTAFCVFNSFIDYNLPEWNEFYSGGKKPLVADYPDNEILILLDAIEKANNDPEVTNLVIDITTNPGGSLDVVMLITSLFANYSDTRYENTMTGQRCVVSYEVDRNLDGKYDEKDAEVNYPLNVAILTSNFSFSCGNMLPALMKDQNILILGERSGGGSCAVQQMVTADGFDYSLSSFRTRLVDKNWQNIDGGVTPHITIERSKLYDIAYLGTLIDQWYANK